jgi:hypothetical protein
MKREEVTAEQFAYWSFLRDKELGLVRGEFAKLSPDEKVVYLEEAKFYLAGHSHLDWPEDILARLTD